MVVRVVDAIVAAVVAVAVVGAVALAVAAAAAAGGGRSDSSGSSSGVSLLELRLVLPHSLEELVKIADYVHEAVIAKPDIWGYSGSTRPLPEAL